MKIKILLLLYTTCQGVKQEKNLFLAVKMEYTEDKNTILLLMVICMRTEQLYYVIAVMKTGSFSKAAEQMYIKQQSLRIAINNLEKELGVVLFKRTSRGAIVTAEGEDYMKEFVKILDIYEKIRRQPGKMIKRETLSLGINSYGGEYVQKYLNKIYESCPSIKIKIHEEERPMDLVKGIENRLYDFAITTIAENILKENTYIHEMMNNEIIFKPKFKIRTGIYVEENHPLTKRKKVSMKNLKNYQLFLLTKYLLRTM